MKIGLIGIGKMGFNLALNLRDHGHDVVAYDKSVELLDKIASEGVKGALTIEELVKSLPERRVIWIMVPAGGAVDESMENLVKYVSSDDIIIDGGNSHYKDTLRRFEHLDGIGIDYVDIGSSGGTEGARNGLCTMVGAKQEVFDYLRPLLEEISVENGCLHTGPNGSGHFVKMVHNGIEYGMMQAIGEGFEILEKCQFDLDFKEIARVWNNGSVIRSWLMELTEKMFKKDSNLDSIKGIVESSGEGLWTLQEALDLKVPVPVIAESLFARYRSQTDETFSGKVVAGLRNEFGGHRVHRKQNV